MKTPHDDSDGMFADLESVPVSRNIVRPPKLDGMISQKTKLARELYLFGNGDGKRVVDINILSQKSGAAPRTIRDWLPVWERENKEIVNAQSRSNSSLRSSITVEQVALHKRHVQILEDELLKMEKIIPSLTVGSDLHCSILKLHRDTLTKWENASGFADHCDAISTANKELMKRAAKLMSEGAGERDVNDNFSFGTSRLNDAAK